MLPFILAYAYVHRPNLTTAYRIFPGLLLESDESAKEARLLILPPDSRQTVMTHGDHITRRNSACYWVYVGEREQMIAEIVADWNHRRCWLEAKNDATFWQTAADDQIQAMHTKLQLHYDSHGLRDQNFDLLAHRYGLIQARARALLAAHPDTQTKEFLDFLLG